MYIAPFPTLEMLISRKESHEDIYASSSVSLDFSSFLSLAPVHGSFLPSPPLSKSIQIYFSLSSVPSMFSIPNVSVSEIKLPHSCIFHMALALPFHTSHIISAIVIAGMQPHVPCPGPTASNAKFLYQSDSFNMSTIAAWIFSVCPFECSTELNT